MSFGVGSGLWARLMHRPSPFHAQDLRALSRLHLSSPPSSSVTEPGPRDEVLLSEEGVRLSRTATSAPSAVKPEAGRRSELPEMEQAESAGRAP